MTAAAYDPENAGTGSEEKKIGVHQEVPDADMALSAERSGHVAEGHRRRASLRESKARSRSGRRGPSFKAASATAKAAMAAGSIAGILLIALVTSRLISCLEAAMSQKTTRQAISRGATDRRLAEGKKPLLTSTDGSAALDPREVIVCFSSPAFSLADEVPSPPPTDIASAEGGNESSLDYPSMSEDKGASPRALPDGQLRWRPLRAARAVLLLTLSLAAGFFLGLYMNDTSNHYYLLPVVVFPIAILVMLRPRLAFPSAGGREGHLETVETRF